MHIYEICDISGKPVKYIGFGHIDFEEFRKKASEVMGWKMYNITHTTRYGRDVTVGYA